MRTVCFTSFTFSYLARARVLAQTLRRIHPDWELRAVIADRWPAGFPRGPLAGFDRAVRAAALGIPDFNRWIFGHDIVEASTAVKATMLRRVLAEKGVTRAVYLDPDIAVFAPLDPVLAEPGAASIVLTPHQAAPEQGADRALGNERTSMRYGIYNLGFLSVAADATGRDFAAWWEARLLEACHDDLAAGIFTDQKYIDLVPALFGGVRIVRDPGCNVASWNLAQRPLAFDAAGGLTAAGAPLRFFHFTKLGSVGEAMIERNARGGLAAHELALWYRRALAAQSDPHAAAHAWAYGRFADGGTIPRAVRRAWRAEPALRAGVEDPFAAAFASRLRRTRLELFARESV